MHTQRCRQNFYLFCKIYHIVFIGPDVGSCYAARPRFWREEGYRVMPCSDQLNIACEKNRRYALPAASAPQRLWTEAAAAVALASPAANEIVRPGRPYVRLFPGRLSTLRRRHLLRRLLTSGYLYL